MQKNYFTIKTVIILFLFSVTIPTNLNAKTAQRINTEKDSVYLFADKMPVFQGGEKELFKYIYNTLKYPKKSEINNIEGKVVVEFIITKKGKVKSPSIVKSVSWELDKEAIRIIKKMPTWYPAEINGKPVTTKQFLPIKFDIEASRPENIWQPNEKTLVFIDSIRMPDGMNTKILNPSKLTSYTIIKPFPEDVRKKIIKKFGSKAKNGVIIITTNKEELSYQLTDTLQRDLQQNCKENIIVPQFNGGTKQLFKYFADSIRYPFTAQRLKTEGKVLVRFLVDKDGLLSNFEVARSLDYFLDKEAIRVVSGMPTWKPASKCGEKLAIYVTAPVEFKLNLPASERKWERNDKTIILLDGKRMPASFELKWINYGNLSSYKVLQPSTPEVTKKLVAEYGKDAANGVVIIESIR